MARDTAPNTAVEQAVPLSLISVKNCLTKVIYRARGMDNDRTDRAVCDIGKQDRAVHGNRHVVGDMEFSQGLTAAIDAWAEAHHINRSDAIRRLIEIGLRAAPAISTSRTVQQQSSEIEEEAVSRINSLLDPSLPPEERERRIRRLTEGPPEFTGHRRDLPKHEKE